MCAKHYVKPKKYNAFRTGTMCAMSQNTEEQVKLLKEAGIDFFTHRFGNEPNEADINLLGWLEKYGVEVTGISNNTRKSINDGTTVFDKDKVCNMWYKDSPMFTEYLMNDEPGMCEFEHVQKSIEDFLEVFPDKTPYVNLLPMYANTDQLKGGAWKAPIEYFDGQSCYKQYLQEYVDKVKTHYIGVDIYPFRRKPMAGMEDKYPAYYDLLYYKDYMKNIELVADACRENGRDLWAYIQTCSWHCNIRDPNEEEIRWQAYCMISFGVRTLEYYTFANAGGGPKTGAPIDVRGCPTKAYFAVKRMALGMKKISDLYVSYRSVGAFNVNSSPEKTPYLELYNPYKDFKPISEVKCNTPLLVGCFDKIEGEGHAFTLVNCQDFATPETANIKVKIDGKVTMYYDGEPTVLTSDDGWYDFTLTQGDGVFVTVD
ncbi:MAG: hypothetical protein IJO74_03885 [Clostridia bacterium]|nr:hypothetical protein [Clostridia bacterium]